jgi:hypothetical protein
LSAVALGKGGKPFYILSFCLLPSRLATLSEVERVFSVFWFSFIENNQFMQNKPNLPDTQINASHVKTKNYEQKTMNCEPTKQSQNKPNQTQFLYRDIM